MWSKKELEEMKNNGAIFLADRASASFTKMPDLKIESSCDEDVKEIRRYIEEQKEKERYKEACRRARKETFWYVMSVVGISLVIFVALAALTSIVVAGYTGQLKCNGEVVPGFVGVIIASVLGCPLVVLTAVAIRKLMGD